MKNIAQMLKQLQQAQQQMGKIQEELAEARFEGTAGGGMVKIVGNGRNEVLSVRIDPEVVDAEDVEMLEDLILAALGDLREKTEKAVREKMSQLAGGLPLGGLF